MGNEDKRMSRIAKQRKTEMESCRTCGKPAVMDVADLCEEANSGFYCSAHVPKIDPPLEPDLI